MMPIFEVRFGYSCFSRPSNLYRDAIFEAPRHYEEAAVGGLFIGHHRLEYLLGTRIPCLRHLSLHLSSLNRFGGAPLEQQDYQVMFILGFDAWLWLPIGMRNGQHNLDIVHDLALPYLRRRYY